MTLLWTLWNVILFAGVVFGGGAACAPRGDLHPVSRLTVGVALALGYMFFVGFAAYAIGVPHAFAALALAVAVAAAIVARRRSIAALVREPEVRAVLQAWLMLAAWSIGLLSLVVVHSGGSWSGDWLEHWQRTYLFFKHLPPETRFLDLYSLPARPPLANVVVALWLEGTRATFAHFQVFMALFGALVLLPAWRLVRMWSPAPQAGHWLLLVLLASPVVAQNLTFAWTKLPTAFFIVAALALWLESNARVRFFPPMLLGLGVLTHYSAVPWLLAMTAAGLWLARPHWRDLSFWRRQLATVAIFVAALAPWLAWTTAQFGWAEAAGSTSTATSWRAQSAIERVRVPLQNITATLVPFLLREEPADFSIVQEDRLGRLRDLAFNVYQVNLPLGLGFAGLAVLIGRLWRGRKARAPHVAAADRRPYFFVLVPTVVVLGIVVHTPPGPWGLAHICLQSLLVIGLAVVAATLAEANFRLRLAWAALAFLDFSLGTVLHFLIQSCVLAPHGDIGAYLNTLGAAARTNALGKMHHQLRFLADEAGVPAALVGVFLASVLACAIWRAARPPTLNRP